MHRGFASWSDNNPRIAFHDVTAECAKLSPAGEGARADCPLAELWVTWIGSPSQRGRVSSAAAASGLEIAGSSLEVQGDYSEALGGSQTAALAQPKSSYSSSFLYTSGLPPSRQQVVQTTAAVVSFNTDLCWYLDSTFCYYFHSLKNGSLSPADVLTLFRAGIWAIWCVALLTIVCQLGQGCCATAEEDKYHGKRLYAVFDAFNRMSTIGIAVRLVLLVTPPAFYAQILMPCWECFDFEAAATHEVGHVLGLSHPDTVAEALCLNKCGSTPGENVYHAQLAAGGQLGRPGCERPWDEVRAGVPPGSEKTLQGGVRPSIMRALTQHNPSVCLSEDDLEALSVLYPDCSHSFSQPVCYKTPHNIGWVRLGVWIGVPTLIALSLLLGINGYLKYYQQRQLDHHRRMRMQRSAELHSARGHCNEMRERHATVQQRLEEQQATEKVRIEREAKRLSIQYIQQHLNSFPRGGVHANVDGAPSPVGPIPRLHLDEERTTTRLPPGRPPARAPPRNALATISDGWNYLMGTPRKSGRRSDRRSDVAPAPGRRPSDEEIEHELDEIQRRESHAHSPPAAASTTKPANAGALARARGLVKQRSVGGPRALTKEQSAGLLREDSATAAEEDALPPSRLPPLSAEKDAVEAAGSEAQSQGSSTMAEDATVAVTRAPAAELTSRKKSVMFKVDEAQSATSEPDMERSQTSSSSVGSSSLGI